MPTATATKSTPRKTRTRKARKSSVKSVSPATKYSQPREIKQVTDTKPAQVRPEKPNLTWEDYRDDVKVRWSIHSYEVNELWNDVVKGYNIAKPFVIKSVDYVKDSYNRAFN
tara:strand:- start:4109 stop:4444 length:336 start_codon:yes stop_codon:yes gene_type:complete